MPRPILDVSQLASALGLAGPAGADPVAAAWDLVALLGSWVEHLDALSWEALLAPTPSRGRSIRNLTVNTFHPVELLPGACRGDGFPWDPDLDGERERALASRDALLAYAARIAGEWSGFVLEAGGSLAGRAEPVETPRGAVGLPELLASQRWHAAYHYRQLVAHAATNRVAVRGAVAVEGLGVELPPEVF